MRLEYQDNIDRFLLDRMPDEERALFEAKCAENLELKEQLEHTRNVKTVISERSKMLAKIQEWDDEYNAMDKKAHNKIMWIYWLSGFAAVLVVGFFLSSMPSESDDTKELVSVNQEPQSVVTEDSGSDNCADNKESGQLLAQTDDDKKGAKGHTSKPEDDHALSFGKADFESTSPQGQDEPEYELKQIEEERSVVKLKMAQLRQELNKGEISQEVYDSCIGLLKYQRDCLSWRMARLHIDLGHRNEALEILQDLRRQEGAFQSKADSLYNDLISP